MATFFRWTSLCTAALLAFTSFTDSASGRTPCVVPQPVEMTVQEGEFLITEDTPVCAEGEAVAEAVKLIELLAPALGVRLRQQTSGATNEGHIALAVDAALQQELGSEGYVLEVTPKRIIIRAAERAGLFYGIQTLRQLLPEQVFSRQRVDNVRWIVPCVAIRDFPRFTWRGLLIDPARHFIPVEDVERFIDAMAIHKLNRLQMHLTDNEGWRVEIKRYPLLTEVGSRMDWNLLHRDGTGPRRFGFYTQEDIRRIVRYAAERHVTIVPEIEMPYHAGAAIAAYPRLGVGTGRLSEMDPSQRWKHTKGLLAPRPETVEFMQHVLREVIELFPGPFIHIGGDEANLRIWSDDPEMQALMKQLDCRDAHALHSWFIRQMDRFLSSQGRRMIGWTEIRQGGLAPDAVLMSWLQPEAAVAAASAGHDVIMAPTTHTYFDYYQGPAESEPKAIGGLIPLEKVYQFEPIPAALDARHVEHVLGGQAQLWGEFIATRQHREYMAWPRGCALSEVVWSPKQPRNQDLFLLRVDRHLRRLDRAGVNYRPLDQPPGRWQGKKDPAAPAAVRGLVRRLLPGRADEFVFEVISPVHGRDVFELETRDAKVIVRGNNGVSMAMGLNWYLKHFCRCHVSWLGSQVNLPQTLPAVQPKLRRVAWARHRYFLNYCCFGYSLPFWDWPQWERLIDWMALNGVNLPLSVTGQEAVWRAVCRELGMGDEQIVEFLAGPPYLPFQWMGCLDGWGGPLPERWIDRHEQLQKKILARQRELGMTPVLQGFTGHVPAAIQDIHPDAKLHKIRWIEWETFLLDPLDPLFPKVARLYAEQQARRFGTDHYYAADTFIEMTPPSEDPEYLQRLSRAIYDGMAATDPEAVWVLQGWAFMYRRSFWTQPRIAAFLNAIPDDRMVLLDLFCESRPMWSQTDAFCGKPWLWCNVQNFGCTIHLGGALDRNNSGLFEARRDPQRGQFTGLGFVNEGLGYNPIVYDQMFEMAWRQRPVAWDQWVRDYSRYRYGKQNEHAETAWQILKDTVYTAPNRTRSIIGQAPSLRAAGGAPYDQLQLAACWRHLLAAAAELGPVDTYQVDLVNVARQVLSNHASLLHQRVVAAYRAGDAEAFRKASADFLQLIRDLDRLLATRREFLLGPWLEDAKRWGDTEPERRQLEWNARRVLTLWGTGPAIDDYARKDWAGLVGDYYHRRWQWYFDELLESLERDEAFDGEAFNRELRLWMDRWSNGQETYAVEPRGDSVAVARTLWERYRDDFKPEVSSLTTGKPVSCSHALPPHPARLANDGFVSNTNRFWATDIQQGPAPAWWQVDLEEPVRVGRVVVVGFYGDKRHYGFTVETSLDGRNWDLVVDRRDNKAPATADGYTCRFEPRRTRYIRVTQTHNSANTGRHLVEVLAFPE